MITITDHVRTWVTTHPLHASFLADGLINSSALARVIRPDIQVAIGEPVSVEAITLALNRHGKAAAAPRTVDIDKYIGEVSVQSGLSLLTIPQASIASAQLIDTVTELHRQQEYTLFTRGVWHTTLIAARETIHAAAQNTPETTIIDNLAAVTIRLKPGHLPVPGVCAYILQKIAQNGINLAETASSYNELTMVVQQRDANRTLQHFI